MPNYANNTHANDTVEERREKLIKEVLALSSGTIGNLIGSKNYAVIDSIRDRWIGRIQETTFFIPDNWKDSWEGNKKELTYIHNVVVDSFDYNHWKVHGYLTRGGKYVTGFWEVWQKPVSPFTENQQRIKKEIEKELGGKEKYSDDILYDAIIKDMRNDLKDNPLYPEHEEYIDECFSFEHYPGFMMKDIHKKKQGDVFKIYDRIIKEKFGEPKFKKAYVKTKDKPQIKNVLFTFELFGLTFFAARKGKSFTFYEKQSGSSIPPSQDQHKFFDLYKRVRETLESSGSDKLHELVEKYIHTHGKMPEVKK